MTFLSPLRVLAACGLASSLLATIGGLAGSTATLGVAGAIMLSGNIYALWRG